MERVTTNHNAELFDKKLWHPIKKPVGAFRPAPALLSANQTWAVIIYSLNCKAEWRSFCRSDDTPCFFIHDVKSHLKKKKNQILNTSKKRGCPAGIWTLHVGSELSLNLFGCHSRWRLRYSPRTGCYNRERNMPQPKSRKIAILGYRSVGEFPAGASNWEGWLRKVT